MAFRFRSATAVAAGTFNIYVIQPRWLAEVGLVREGVKVQLKSDLNRPGFLYSSEELPTDWDVRPDRLTLIAKTPAIDCGSLLADVIEKLPWTPLIGVGANVEFVGELADIDKFPCERTIPKCEPPAGYECKQRTVHVALARGPHIFNLQMSVHEDRTELSINVHTELKGQGNQATISTLAQRSCREFFALRDESIELVRKLFCVEVEP